MAATPIPPERVRASPEGGEGPPPPDIDSQSTLPPSSPGPRPPAADDTATLPPSTAGTPRPAPVAVGFPRVTGYEILAVLGEGGMGVVYKARHTALQRTVALKMIRGSFLTGADQRQRFHVEAEAVARLQHPNIVQIYEVGDVNVGDGSTVPFMALEFVDGTNLEHHLQGRPMSPAAAAAIVADLARAMTFAHERSIIHRDLKPANVLLAKRDTASQTHISKEPAGRRRATAHLQFCPKITDFGLAKQIDTATSQTKAGEIMGTPSYMAPEQAEARPDIGPPVDIYALGAILYELLTGRPPFRAATSLDTIFQVLGQEPVPPARLQPGIPRDVETICLKCLEKLPAKRYASAAELADDVDRFLADEPILARPVPAWEKTWKWAKRRPSAAALVVVSALALVGLFAGGIWFNHAVRLERDAALTAESEARAAKSLADEKARESQQSLDQLSLANGVRLAEGGDLFAGLSWFTRPLDPAVVYRTHERINRDRIIYYLAYTPRPTLRHNLGHGGAITGAGFSLDGTLIVTASADQTAQVWDAETGKAVGPPLRHAARVHQATFSPDSRTVLTISADKTARLWDAHAGTPRSPPMTHPGEVIVGDFSPDGRTILTVARGGKQVFLWDATTGHPAGEPLLNDVDVNFATFGSDRRTVVVATGKEKVAAGGVQFWDLASRKAARPPVALGSPALHVAVSRDGSRAAVVYGDRVKLWTIARPDDKPIDLSLENGRQVTFTPDGRRLVTFAESRKLFVWDTVTGLQVGQTIESRDQFHAFDVSPDGRYIAAGNDDKTTRVWNLETGKPVTPPLWQRNYINAVAFAPDGRRLLAAGDDNTARVWDLACDQPAPSVANHHAWVFNFAFSPDGRRIVTASGDKSMGVWDAVTARPLHPPIAHPDLVKEAWFSRDGSRIVSACRDGVVRLWDAEIYSLVREFKGHEKIVTAVRFSPNGDTIYSAGLDGTARIWDVASGKCRHVLKCGSPQRDGDLSPDGRMFFTGGDDGLVRIWDTTTGELARPPLRGHTDMVAAGAFCPDGRLLATTAMDYSTRLWNTATGEAHCPPMIHDGAMMRLAFSRDGRLLATTSEDNTARLWDTATGRAVTPPLIHPGWALDAAFSPAGDRVLTTARSHAARIWNTATGQPISPFIEHPSGRIVQGAYSADEARFVTCGSDGGLFIWPIPVDERPTEDLIREVEVYHGFRLDRFGGFSAIPHDEYRTLWRTVLQRYPADFAVSTKARSAWHRREMEAAVREGNAGALVFHFLHAYPKWLSLVTALTNLIRLASPGP
jgi:WD40 repeat protein/serine/threonine protein kinase